MENLVNQTLVLLNDLNSQEQENHVKELKYFTVGLLLLIIILMMMKKAWFVVQRLSNSQINRAIDEP